MRVSKKWVLLLLPMLGLAWSPARAEDERQYKIEAAFLYNFFNYITWPGYTSPESLQRPTICVMQGDPVTPYLTYVQKKKAAERDFYIRELTSDVAGENCHLFFRRTRSDIPTAAVSKQTLVISEQHGYVDGGGMIELTRDSERLDMKINHSRLEQEGFQVSSRLLDLAKRVR